MKKLNASDPVMADLCRAWGFTPDEVREIHFHCEAGGIAYVEIGKFVTEDEGHEAVGLLERYELVAVEDE